MKANNTIKGTLFMESEGNNMMSNEDVQKILQHLINIGSRKYLITEEEVLNEKNETVKEIMVGLMSLAENIQFHEEGERKAKAQLVDKADLEKVNKELSDFAYVVSHDLKAPLRAIANLSEWLYHDYSDKLAGKGKEYIDLIIQRAKRMETLINEILDYSKVGKKNVKKESTDLNELIENVISFLAPPNSIEITIEKKLPVVYTEKIYLHQLFQNLIGNAIKYMDKPNGKITILFSEKERSYVFGVKDNGPGIEKKYHDKIFKVFQTLSSKDDYESTGIGLSLVKKIVSLNNGEVWLVSEYGHGSTFYFEIPHIS